MNDIRRHISSHMSSDPRHATTSDQCLELAERLAAGYPLSCGWLQCLDSVLPPLADEVPLEGRSYRNCLAFLLDDELGPHFIFDEGNGLEELLLSEVEFAAPLSQTARLWIRSYRRWRDATCGSSAGKNTR